MIITWLIEKWLLFNCSRLPATVWPVKNRQMSIKMAKKLFHYKNEWFGLLQKLPNNDCGTWKLIYCLHSQVKNCHKWQPKYQNFGTPITNVLPSSINFLSAVLIWTASGGVGNGKFATLSMNMALSCKTRSSTGLVRISGVEKDEKSLSKTADE